jgi:hypothetical protein
MGRSGWGLSFPWAREENKERRHFEVGWVSHTDRAGVGFSRSVRVQPTRPLPPCVSVLNAAPHFLLDCLSFCALRAPESRRSFWVAIQEGAGLLGRHGLASGRR